MPVTEIEDIDLTKDVQVLESLLTPVSDGAESQLKQYWRYLQVYADWGLRLPTEDSEYATLLNAGPTSEGKKLAEFDFYPFMRDGARQIKSASNSFVVDYLPQIIGVGNTLAIFAENAAEGEGQMFQEIINLVKPDKDSGEEPDFESAKEVLDDMISDAHKALAEVDTTQKSLAEFKKTLTIASGKCGEAKKLIDTNSDVNDAALKSMNDPDDENSVAKLEELKKAVEEEYDHAVIVASTSVTYAWVGLPFVPVGLIAAGTVAGVFGKKAVDLMDQIEQYEEKIKTASAAKRTAIGTQSTYRLAAASATNLIKYTDHAILATSKVQGGWNEILKNLQGLSKMLDQTMQESDGEQQLRSATMVAIKLKNVGRFWTKLYPFLQILSTNPYIAVTPGNVSVKDFKKDVEAALEQAA